MSRRAQSSVKRATDIGFAIVGLVIMSPLIVLIAIGIRITMGQPVLFRQVRPGLSEQPFELVKFRTMLDLRDASGQQLNDAERLTRIGAVLRKTSLDELPSLWNVLRGDMSLVGPRPLLMRYLPHFTETERIRFSMRPGITGWAQVRGRNRSSWDQRLADDVWYVENWSFFLDMRILVLTLARVIRSSGVETDPTSVMKDLDVERG